MDNLSVQQRSDQMRLISARDTRPEMIVRRAVYRMGYRYRLHDRSLPGTPDLVFSKRKEVIFVHGCFWHRHRGCRLARLPKSRTDYWEPKLSRNQERDTRSLASLKDLGWKVLTIWECELRGASIELDRVLRRFLGPRRSNGLSRLHRLPR
jgi:DNA mismatch endonuclease (patch repair protein)